jgi:ribonuclease G
VRRELVIAAGPGEWRAAWLEDDAAVELLIERGDDPPAGSIHLGRVVRHVAGLTAALVDIGAERPGFLPLRRSSSPGAKAPRPLDEGARVIVEVRREAQRAKGALLSARIAAERLAQAAERAQRLEPPAQLVPQPGFAALLALRLPGAPARVVTDDLAALPELRRVFPGAEVVHAETADLPLDIGAAIETTLASSLALPGGGTLHIAPTDAAILMDVDTGSPAGDTVERNAIAVNLAAAAEIARQLRLRQLGGGIIVDFAALEGRRPREAVREAVAAALAGDPAQPQVLGWTRLGHLEIVRPRRHRPLAETMLDPRTGQKSAVALAFECLRDVAGAARARPAANWRINAAPAVATALRGPGAAALRMLEDRLGRRVTIAITAAVETPPFDIVPQ